MHKQVLECTTKTAFYMDIVHKVKTKKYVAVTPKRIAFVRAWRKRKQEARQTARSKPHPFHLKIEPTNKSMVATWRDSTHKSKLPASLTATVIKVRTLTVNSIDEQFPGGVLISKHYRPGTARPIRDKYHFHRNNSLGVLVKRVHYEITFRLHGLRSDKHEKGIGGRAARHTKYFLRSRCNQTCCGDDEVTASESE